MNLSAVEMNLLVLLEPCWTSACAARRRRVGLSQPAASHAWRGLRDLFDDPLLVRVGTAMVRTLGRGTAEATRAIRASAQAVLRMDDFQSHTSKRPSRFMLPDLVSHLIMHRWSHALPEPAPASVSIDPVAGARAVDRRTLARDRSSTPHSSRLFRLRQSSASVVCQQRGRPHG